MSSVTSGEKARRPVYFSKFSLTDYLREREAPRFPPPPTIRDFMNAANKLRPTAKPFIPQSKLNPLAEEFQPKISGGGRRPPREREEIITDREQEQDWPRTVN